MRSELAIGDFLLVPNLRGKGAALRKYVAFRLWGFTVLRIRYDPCPFHQIWRIDPMRQWQCLVCGFVYDEAEGLPDHGIAPGTAWEDVPEDWQCPDCGVGKSDFEMVEV